MIDHIDSRMWADHGHDFSASIAGALSKAWLAFQRLNAIQFDAPWERKIRHPNRPGQA
jgi:hypothetical protein